MTNLGWTVDARRLARAVRLDTVRLINDLGAGVREGLLAKGRMRPLLEVMPVRLILNDMVGLIGAPNTRVGDGQASAAGSVHQGLPLD